MAFQGRFPARSKISQYNQCMEPVEHFNYFGCDVSFVKDQRLSKLCYTCGGIQKILGNK